MDGRTKKKYRILSIEFVISLIRQHKANIS